MSSMVFNFSFFNSVILSLLKLVQICYTDKFAFFFCGTHKFVSDFQIRFKFAVFLTFF